MLRLGPSFEVRGDGDRKQCGIDRSNVYLRRKFVPFRGSFGS
jgi:hypothetical protein